MSRASALPVAVALAATLVSACGADRSGRDATASVDSTKFGDDRASQGDIAPTVRDVAVLERLIDQYEGLDVVMDAVAGPTSGSPVQGKSWKGDRHEDAAKDRLLDVLQTEFGERYQPRTPKGAAHTADSISALAHDAGTRALDALVLTHHRGVVRTIGDALPSLRNARVREVLVDLSQRLRKEIQELSERRPPSGS
jgi:hypothetical protein